jgi:hypothetical protein
MYYPYLRGRQFELIALREFAMERGDNNNIVAIIEPVKKSLNSIKLAVARLSEGNVGFAIILNPEVGEVTGPGEILDEISDQLADNRNFIPALILNDNYDQVNHIISEFNLSGVMLICRESIDTNSPEFESIIFSDNVRLIVSPENRTLKRKLAGRGKELIRLDDNFKGQRRNSDYINMPDEKFSEEHLYYVEDAYQGFSDFTIVVSEFSEGGAAPYAVAIHLTYQKSNGEIWIRHFVSETNDDRSNIQGKFAEASSKAVIFLDQENIHSNASEELRRYFYNSTYPGLGTIKKLSIKNHLELINSILPGHSL